MPVDDPDGRLRVTGTQGLEYLLVFGEGLGDPVGVGVHHGDAHPQLAVAQLVVEPGQDVVAAAADDLGVEAAVGDGGPGQVTGGGLRLLLLQEFFEPPDQPGGWGTALRAACSSTSRRVSTTSLISCAETGRTRAPFFG